MIDLTEELQERVDLIKHKLKFIEQKPAVACIVNLDPIAFADDTIAELITIAGGITDTHLQNSDVIIVMPAGSSIENSMKSMDRLLQLPGFSELKAVKNNRLYIADNNGQHPVDTLELLAEIINPKQFIFGYEGDKWIKFGV
jgi:iron complex transport system substrate-binding protein